MKKERLLLLLFVVLFIVSAIFPFSSASADTGKAVFVVGSSNYTYEGNIYTMDVSPYMKNGRVFVPVRYLAIACGVNPDDIDYFNGHITITKGSTTVELAIGYPVIIVNGKTSWMDVAPEMVNGRTFLPARWVAEALGYQVSWDELTQSVIITKKSYTTNELIAIVQPAVVYIETQRGQGSGFLISSDGEILTNSHVVAGASFINVTTYNGRTYRATVEKAIPYIDLAILRTKDQGFPYLSPTKTKPQVGDQILVFGHPLGVKNTVSQGVISSVSKDISEIDPDRKNFKVIQMSAPIYPGNSGGPVVNLEGEVIGIASFIYGASTLSFAIPIDYYYFVLARPYYNLQTDFEMFIETYWQEWNPKEKSVHETLGIAEQYRQEGRIFAQLTAFERAINTIEELEADVSSYTAQYTEIDNLRNTYLKRLEMLRQVFIRFQEAARLLDPANAYNTYAISRAYDLLDESQYYINQYNSWDKEFVEQYNNLWNRLYR